MGLFSVALLNLCLSYFAYSFALIIKVLLLTSVSHSTDCHFEAFFRRSFLMQNSYFSFPVPGEF